MKKITLGFVVCLVIVVVPLIYLDIKKNNSHATPEDALSYVKNPKHAVLEVIDKKFFDGVAYVFYYSQVGETPKNYLAAARLQKNMYGWQFDEILGVGNIEVSNVGMASGKDDYIVGLAPKQVHKVIIDKYEAEMITIDRENIRAFLFHEVEADLMGQTEFQYFDEEGNKLYY
ncbi:hypothetical protein [Halobacillus sp. Nhm2S1]|uniref:hypothetical protein n=1 Tax=Halobacillus sp. Nhm2S1 TaxID=2866716 RepID=UPI001C73181F|nr:hypothetical protein [Halobacillus sp. Nhm2S1]MBX0358428.1 hypothetical protein [Halobacillus sp. Nhm2S1]